MPYEYDATGIQPSEPKDFSPVPAGDYHLVIKDSEAKWTTKNDPMERVKCLIDEGFHKGRIVWHNVTFLPKDNRGAGMAIHFLKTIGEPYEGKFLVNTADWIGKRFLARIEVKIQEKGKNAGKPINEITMVMPVKDGVPYRKLTDDEVPF